MARANVVRIHSLNSMADDLQSAIDGFLAYCKSKNLSCHTIGYYAYRLHALQIYLAATAEPTGPNRLTPQTIRAFLTAEAGQKSATLDTPALFVSTLGVRLDHHREHGPKCKMALLVGRLPNLCAPRA